MSEFRVANRYAKSLLDLSKEQNSLDVVFSDMKTFLDVMTKSPELEKMLKSPLIHGDKKMSVINLLFGKSFHKNTLAFFDIIIRKKREFYLKGVAKAFVEQYNKLNNVAIASVKTATAIDQSVLEEIRLFIEKQTGKKIEVKFQVEPELIGGLVVQMDDKLFDASISGKLQKIKNDLLNSYISK